MDKPRASIVSVAREAGVSLQTVSNVLNFPERVKPETTAKVLAAIDKLNYTPNLSARRLRSRKSSTIAVRVDSNAPTGKGSDGLYAGYIQDEFVYELVRASEIRGIKVFTYTCDPSESEVEKLKQLINSRDVDGFVLTSTVEEDPRLSYLIQRNVPFLSFGRPWGSPAEFANSYPWIDVDGASGTRDATNMFWKKGHRTIGFLGWKTPNFNSANPKSVADDRLLGWSQRYAELRDLKPKNLVREYCELGDETIASARAATVRLLARHPEIDAIVCVSDTLALGAQMEIAGLKKTIPVCGFDNSPTSKVFNFSSLDQNISEVASLTLKVLIGEEGNSVRKFHSPNQITEPNLIIPPRLIVR
jgi:DNA-binding LacI/PurR family transcriptional regulator